MLATMAFFNSSNVIGRATLFCKWCCCESFSCNFGNKMVSLGEKTPVSRLQEFLVSKKMFPHYELTHNGAGTQNPCFTYRVQVGVLWEEASGRSKREAKHRAAEKLLKTLNVIDSTEEEDSSDFNMEPAENFVGELKELCISLCYPDPKYYLEEFAGPPHCRIFRMQCCVSQLQDHGIASTKKQAKQEAAWKMLRRLRELKANATDIFPIKTEEVKNPETKKTALSSSDIIEKYVILRPSAGATTINKDFTVFYKDHHKAFIGLQLTSPTLLKILNGTSKANADSSLNLVKDIAQELEVTISSSEISTAKDNKPFILLAISVFPPIVGLGNTMQNAALNLLNSLLFLSKE